MLNKPGTGKRKKAAMFFLALLVPFFVFFLSIVCSPRPVLYRDGDFSWSVTDRTGKLLWLSLSDDQKYRYFVPLKSIPKNVVEATLLYEDRDFYGHCGVNFLSLFRAVHSMALGGRRLGASTVTMQLVRLAEKEKTDTIPKKIWQMWKAFVYEYHFTKDEILEAYLNLAPYGSNVEGIGAASLVWFHKNVQELNIAESIALVTVPQNPQARSPLRSPNDAWDKARARLFAMWNEENPSPYNKLFSTLPLKVYGPRDLPFHCPHAVLEIYKDRFSKQKNVQGNFVEEQKIVTSLDLTLQQNLEKVLAQYVADKKSYGIKNGAMLLADWQKGEILSVVGSADFYDKAISGQIDGTDIPRSPGSTLKPFIYALALEQGLIHSKTILVDTEKSFAGYEPENADGSFQGPIYADTALKNSRNIPAINLSAQLKNPDLYAFLKKAEIVLPQKREYYGLALVLGGAEIRLRDLADLYAMLANRGFYRKLSFYPGENNMERPLLSPESGYIVLKMLETKSPYPFSSVLASWKTGTSNGQRDALTAGVIGPYVLIVWIGNFDASPNPNFIGSKAALPLFFQAAEKIQQLKHNLGSAAYSPEDLSVKEINVCASTGDINLALCPDMTKVKAYFIPGKSPIKETGVLRKILINSKTGLRECKEIEGVTKTEIYEFWSAELQRLFGKAGVYKRPIPPYSLECLKEMKNFEGNPPRIISPVEGISYQQDARNSLSISLLADADADVGYVHWFVDNSYLGYVKKNETLSYKPKAGRHTVYAVDEFGRSCTLSFVVEKVGF